MIVNNPRLLDGAKVSELTLQSFLGDLEEQVADIECCRSGNSRTASTAAGATKG